MPRIRMVKPDFFLDEELCAHEPLTRLLYEGLWCLADREGRLLDRPKQIKVQVLPYDDYDVDKGLNDLQDTGHIKRYEAKGMKIIWIVKLKKHQTFHYREKPSSLPDINGEIPEQSQDQAPQEPKASPTQAPQEPGKEQHAVPQVQVQSAGAGVHTDTEVHTGAGAELEGLSEIGNPDKPRTSPHFLKLSLGHSHCTALAEELGKPLKDVMFHLRKYDARMVQGKMEIPKNNTYKNMLSLLQSEFKIKPARKR